METIAKIGVYLLTLVVAFSVGYCQEREELPRQEKERVVTKVKVDTLIKYYPMPYMVYQTGDTIHVTDTILKVEAVEYKDSDYRIKITGYRTRLEYVEVYPKTITNTIYKERRWGIGVTAGYGISKDGLSPGIMIGISYRIF